MAVPDFQSFFNPVLEIATDGGEHSLKEARERVARAMRLSEQDLGEILPSGIQTKFDNRISWAISYLVQAGVLMRPRRGVFHITDRGRDLIAQGHQRVDVGVLNQYPEFLEFHKPRVGEGTPGPGEPPADETPEEALQRAYQSIRGDLVSEILSRIKTNSAKFFESLVVDLMVAMGYGGSRADAGSSVGQSGDEGVDGIIKEDRLGLDAIYLQAKRWDGTVGRPEIQKFVGALHGKRAKKGVFITTGRFSEDSLAYVANIDPKVILIDGPSLANYMIDFNLGVATIATYNVKRMDSDYFAEE